MTSISGKIYVALYGDILLLAAATAIEDNYTQTDVSFPAFVAFISLAYNPSR